MIAPYGATLGGNTNVHAYFVAKTIERNVFLPRLSCLFVVMYILSIQLLVLTLNIIIVIIVALGASNNNEFGFRWPTIMKFIMKWLVFPVQNALGMIHAVLIRYVDGMRLSNGTLVKLVIRPKSTIPILTIKSVPPMPIQQFIR